MESWVGPAIVAAIISGLVSLILVQLNFRQSRRFEQLRRAEKVRDFQIALRAEIASDLLNMQVADRLEILETLKANFAADPGYFALVPRLATNLVFEAVVKEIQILPGDVISPVVQYARLRQTLEGFIEDIRSNDFRQMGVDRRLLIYSDYLAMFERLEALAEQAKTALDVSLGISKSGAAPSSRASASGSDAVLPERSVSP